MFQAVMPPNADEEDRRMKVVQALGNNPPWRATVEPDVVSKVRLLSNSCMLHVYVKTLTQLCFGQSVSETNMTDFDHFHLVMNLLKCKYCTIS